MKLLLLALSVSCVSLAAAQTVTYSDVYTFTGGADGQQPFGQLVLAGDGALYGMNVTSGVFRLDPNGTLTIPLPLGSTPNLYPHPITSGPDGALYVTVNPSGTSTPFCAYIDRLDLSGSATTFYQVSCDSYNTKLLDITLGPNNSFYGFAYYGDYLQYGALFQLSSSGVLTVLHAYTADDYGAIGDLFFSSSGIAYVITHTNQGCDAIYQFDTSWNPTVVSGFGCNNSDLGYSSDLVEASNGNLYGISPADDGSYLFSISTGGDVSVVGESPTNGEYVSEGLPYSPSLDASGNFYGFGNFENGDFFQASQTAQFSNVYTLNEDNDNEYELLGSMVQGIDGAFYGAAYGDTSYGADVDTYGTIYRLAVSSVTVPPVQLNLSESNVSVGDSTTLSWSVSNAFSISMQQCYALVQNNATGAGTWTGLQTGTVSNGAYVGSATITPTEPGFYTYALTCGGFESGFASLTVGSKATTSLNLTTTSPVTLGSYTMLTASVSTTENVGPLTGSVAFSSGNVALGTASLSGGSASLNVDVSSIPTGTYPVTATYSGDTNYQRTSATANLVVVGYATSTSVSASLSSVVQGEPFALTAVVSRISFAGVPTGSVTFYYGSSALGTASLKNGIATLSTPDLGDVPAGAYAVHAVYSGDSTDQPAISPNINISVLTATATLLVASPNPVPSKSSVTLTARITQIYGLGIPAGSVTFSAANNVISVVNLDQTGRAVLNVSDTGLPAGNYQVTATYSGGTNANNASSSGSVLVAVQ